MGTDRIEQDKLDRIKILVKTLKEASKAYYAEDREIISNFEYDRLYDELVSLENETGIILSDSPTILIGYEAVENLPKERHESPMLSLGKTKDRAELQDWLKDKEGLLSWKMDGLTIVLTYDAGKLAKAVTRGNGEVGEVITNNARTFKNLPVSIPYTGELILRGEAVITYSDFDKINTGIEDVQARYKNPRNLCSGSVRQLNNEITAQRNVRFYSFSVVKAEGVDFSNSREMQLAFLKQQGFEVVEYKKVDTKSIQKAVEEYEQRIADYDIPSDGLVLTYEDMAYGKSLGRTAKFPRDSIAFKWTDEVRETVLTDIEWSPSRTGLINPVAIFEPVELEGTTVSRASVHNISILQNLKLGIGDVIMVYKANMIIPQIAENLTGSGTVIIPGSCPACGGPTQIKKMSEAESLYCINLDCTAKKIKAFTLFVSRDAMNMDGLSEATLEKFIGKGYIHEFADIFHLSNYKDEIVSMEGFGEKSYQNLVESIERSRKTVLHRVIYGLGIANIGVANAKMLCRYFEYDLDRLRTARVEELSKIEGVGDIIATAIMEYMNKEENLQKLDNLCKELEIEIPVSDDTGQTLTGKTFVITGSLNGYESRAELKELIESKGGKVAGSVTGKTECLLNNDISSNSSKNKKAKELGIPIFTEEEFVQKYMTE